MTRVGLFMAGCCAALAAACTMGDSQLIDDSRHMGCTRDGGTYYLPRTMVKVVVHERPDLENSYESGRYFVEEITANSEQDRRFPYCLDFLAAITSEDTFIVSRTQNLLLNRISSVADDKSVEIAKAIIQTIFTAITQDPQFGTARGARRPVLGGTKRIEFKFDPFDLEQTDLINDALGEFGFCIVVETKEFLASGHLPQSYCDNPLGSRGREQLLLKANYQSDADHYMPEGYSEGIFYRPRLPYRVFVLKKKNLQARGGWRLLVSKTILFENGSPVFVVPVDRTYFAKRETNLAFNNGELIDVTIDKESELLGFVQIPLAIAQSVAAVPGSILKVKIDATNNRAALLDAQTKLLQNHKTYLETLKTFQEATNPAPPVAVAAGTALGSDNAAGLPASAAQTAQRSAQTYEMCFADCAKDPALAANCTAFCECKTTQCPLQGDAAACAEFCPGLIEQ